MLRLNGTDSRSPKVGLHMKAKTGLVLLPRSIHPTPGVDELAVHSY
jgi:hypothetical protein